MRYVSLDCFTLHFFSSLIIFFFFTVLWFLIYFFFFSHKTHFIAFTSCLASYSFFYFSLNCFSIFFPFKTKSSFYLFLSHHSLVKKIFRSPLHIFCCFKMQFSCIPKHFNRELQILSFELGPTWRIFCVPKYLLVKIIQEDMLSQWETNRDAI